MIEKVKLQDMCRIVEINKQIAKLEDEIMGLRSEEHRIWEKNNNSFEFEVY